MSKKIDTVQFIENRFQEGLQKSNNLENTEVIAELALEMKMYGDKGRSFINRLESELLKRGFIHTKINNRESFWKNIGKDPNINRALYYISIIRDPLIHLY